MSKMQSALTTLALAALLVPALARAQLPSACYSDGYGDRTGSDHALPMAVLEGGGILYNVTVRNPCISKQTGVLMIVCDEKLPLVFTSSLTHAVVIRHPNKNPANLVVVAFCSGFAAPAEKGHSLGSVQVSPRSAPLRSEDSAGARQAEESSSDSSSEEDCE